MVNSKPEWNIEYLRELRVKFLDQGYPLKLINGEFQRALEIDRMDLLFNENRKKKRQIIAPLVITYNRGNPNFKEWIKEELYILHQDSKAKEVFPKIDVVTRQGQNISSKVIKSRHWKYDKDTNNNATQPQPPQGNFKKHSKNCVTCKRMTDGKTEFQSSRTKRKYKITRHYTCESTHLVYLARCRLCNVDYIGQTTQSMRQRHLGHRAEIRSGADGLGKHFLSHGQNLNLKKEEVFEGNIMQYFDLVKI